jgi:ABC-2 type transport system ATP-binding protein
VAEPCVIDLVDLHKDYDGHAALNGASLQVPRGSIFGFLGRNGSGKTTTIKILLGMVRPTRGSATVFGLPTDEPGPSVAIRQRIGFVSEDKDLVEAMTVEELLSFTRAFYPRWRRDLADRYLRQFNLPPTRQTKALSKGMRTKLALLLAFARGADLLLLDEPTSGLDPAASEEVLQAIVGHVASEDMTVFFSSHQLAEVEQIADRIGILDRGQTVLSGALDDLQSAYRRVQLVFAGDAPAVQLRSPGIRRIQRRGRVITILAASGADAIVEEARALQPTAVDVQPITLKDIFLDSVSAED